MYPTEADLQSEDWPGLIDTHCHLDLEPLYTDLAGVISRATQAGVTSYVVPGVHPDGWERISRIAESYQVIFPAYGIHPMHADCATDDRLQQLAAVASRGVAIGEIGLDPNYAVSMDLQEHAFRLQLRLAVDLGLPVLIHCRKAFQHTLKIMREEHADRVGGIMHAFSGSAEMAREFIRLGCAISISGMSTRSSAVRVVRVVESVPLEYLVLETDSPDLPPQRYLGLPNEPAYMLETLHAVARIKKSDPHLVAVASRATSLRILGALGQS